MTRFLCWLAFAAPCAPAPGLELSSLFSDHMVLQRGKPVPVFGRAGPGEEITVTFADAAVSTLAGADGSWRIDLPALEASEEPRVLSIRGRDGMHAVEDVLVGEVWICSGQSNMEWRVEQSLHAEEFRRQATDPAIRVFKVAHTLENEPQESVSGRWTVCSPETAGQFTAVGYHFGRELRAALGVPVGLIDSSFGGSRAEPWTPEAFLARHEVFAERLARQHAAIAEYRRRDAAEIEGELEELERSFAAEAREYWSQIEKLEPGFAAGWMKAGFDFSTWGQITLPCLWEESGLGQLKGLDGAVWFQRGVTLPADWAGRDLVLELGRIDDSDRSWYSGVEVGSSVQDHDRPRVYEIPGSLVTPARTSLCVMVVDTGGGGGLTGPAADMTLSRKDGQDEPVPLSGTWRYRVGLRASALIPPPSRPGPPAEPGQEFTSLAAMYNGMIHPFVPSAIRGAVWYQGESNAGEPEEYRELLPLLIEGWRHAFQQGDLPFGIVQLASFRAPAPDRPVEGGWAELRDAQLLVHRTVPSTGLVVTTDLGDARDIHPRNKHEVGRRLALWALATVYGQDLVYSGPLYRSMTFEGDGAVLSFDHVGGGLKTRDGDPPAGFAIAGEDGAFVWAEAEIHGDRVRVWAPGVDTPRAVRLGWCNNPEALNLINAEGLPASPFRTDGAR